MAKKSAIAFFKWREHTFFSTVQKIYGSTVHLLNWEEKKNGNSFNSSICSAFLPLNWLFDMIKRQATYLTVSNHIILIL